MAQLKPYSNNPLEKIYRGNNFSLKINLTTETVKCPSLPLESVDDIHGRHRLTPGVLRVGNGVANNVFQKDLEDAASLLVDQAADPLHAASTSQSSYRGLGDALDIIPENLPVTFGSALAQPFASLATARHLLIRGVFQRKGKMSKENNTTVLSEHRMWKGFK
ncbi:hypothetical protein GQ457_08G012570 [Hibiscus cannabinus]